MIEPQRKIERFSSIHPVEVTCKSWEQFRQLYTNNISRGGCFLRTHEPAPAESDITVQFCLPRGHSLTLEAKVVHAVTRERADSEGLQPGMGVRFVGIDGDKQRLIQALMELAELDQPSPATAQAHASEAPAPDMPSLPPPLPPKAAKAPEAAPPPLPTKAAKTAPPQQPVIEELPPEGNISSAELFGDFAGRTPTGAHPIVSVFLHDTAQEHLEKERYQKAEQEFEQILASEPTNKPARIGLLLAQGLSLAQQGAAKPAAEKLQEVLALAPGHPKAQNALSKLQQPAGRPAGKGMMARLLGKK